MLTLPSMLSLLKRILEIGLDQTIPSLHSMSYQTLQNIHISACKHKHMMKSGAPPDKVRVLHRLLPIEFHGFTYKIDF